jgi:hypothetical protein
MTDTNDLVARLRAYEPYNHFKDGPLIREAADTIERLTIERDEARAAALEEAAKVADGMRLDLSGPYPADREDYHFNDALEQAAENIRALKEPT